MLRWVAGSTVLYLLLFPIDLHVYLDYAESRCRGPDWFDTFFVSGNGSNISSESL